MCFFEQTLWHCGYWRWGHFRQQCNKEYRTGETCGLKMVHETIRQTDVCRLCKDIQKKERKRDKLMSDIARWELENYRSPRGASIAKARDDLYDVQTALEAMHNEHDDRAYSTVDYGGR